MTRRWAWIGALCLLLLPRPAVAEAPPIYLWADAAGVVLTVSSRLEDVPEPFRAAYSARQMRANHGAEPAPTAAATAGSATAQAYAMRQNWRRQVATWRQEILLACEQLAAASSAMEGAQRNPILRLSVAGQAKIDALTPSLDAARLRLQKARSMLLEGLPRAAQAAHVPPAWLQ